MTTLFPNDNLPPICSTVPDLLYIPNFIDKDTHDILWQAVYQHAWLGDLKRRVQHYGYKYDYKARTIHLAMKIGDLPLWAHTLADQLSADDLMGFRPDQLIVNEYTAGQGISAHIDCTECFDHTIASLSLGSGCVMDFSHRATNQSIPVFLEPCSLVLLRGAARYQWQHAIAARKTDRVQGQRIERKTRVSLTFRKILLHENL